MADNSVRFSETELPAVLRSLAQHYGGIGKMARRFGVDPSNLNKACKGQKPP